ncbi:hypothetical protein AUQ44_13270 [Vibrio cidicii]|uniref:tRNA-uridine aminocarboxypropyltransferase n=1 Tax=Vibrio cidicii TaxID=1763883 RepID=A0A151JKE4_9VIBR|nr:DTW domain-containing protein [Vibrio cidicii]KYN26136.1 hypothetical protein AUQ44_13270 [Vibrio cidicii]
MSRYCSRCGKAKKACLCQWIRVLPADTELIILQHPSEEHRPLGSARILSLSLANSRCFIGEDFTHHQELNHLLCEEGYQHWLLYPSDKAYPLSDLTQKNAVTGKLRVILLDGTWKKAFKMWQLSSNLHALPCVKLPDNLVGNYVIRKAPSENSLSTLEAGYHLLSLLEPQRDFTPLLTAFHNMIEFQIAQMPPGVFEQNYRKR